MVQPILNIFERLLNIYETRPANRLKLIVWNLMALFAEANRYIVDGKPESENLAVLLTQQYKKTLTQHMST